MGIPMARLFPFRALHPPSEQAAAVAAVPYDVVNREEARRLADGRPLSFLHVSRAEIDLPPDVDPYADEVYRTAAQNFARLRASAPLVHEEIPSLYAYRLAMGTHQQTGVAGCYSLDEYEGGTIVRHERTRKDKEDDRTRHMLELSAQTGPVFLTYPAAPSIDRTMEEVTSTDPLIDFTADDGVRHTLWRVPDSAAQALVAGFGRISRLYIADGHHRAASAFRARDAVRSRHAGRDSREADWFLAVAFPDVQTQILPYHRVVKDLNGYTPATFLAALRERCVVTSGADTPAGKGRVSMYLQGQWHEVSLGTPPPTVPMADRLDVALLQDQVLRPLLHVDDPRVDRRIDFVGGIRGPGELRRLVDSGAAAVAFALHPVGVDDLMAVSDAGGIMPPKSTWFEPKLRDGLLVHLI
jgi:uncharacterized protein (DUF1015 family)